MIPDPEKWVPLFGKDGAQPKKLRGVMAITRIILF
jgi:hypothetical protein